MLTGASNALPSSRARNASATSWPVRTLGGGAGTSSRRALSRQIASTMPVSAERVSARRSTLRSSARNVPGIVGRTCARDGRRRRARASSAPRTSRSTRRALWLRRVRRRSSGTIAPRAVSSTAQIATLPEPAHARARCRRRLDRAPAATSQPSTSPTGIASASAVPPPGSGTAACACPSRLRRARRGEQLRDLVAVADRRVRTAGPRDDAARLPRHLQEDRAVGRHLLFGLDRFAHDRPAGAGAGRFASGRACRRCVRRSAARTRRPAAPARTRGRRRPGPAPRPAACARSRGAPPLRAPSSTATRATATGFASSTASCSGVATPSASAPTYMSNCHGARSSTPINGFTRLHLPVAGGFGVHPRRSAGGSCHFRVPPARRPRRCRPVSMHCAVGTIAADQCRRGHEEVAPRARLRPGAGRSPGPGASAVRGPGPRLG